jgi:ABC-type transport system substrate-binding protein
MVGGFSVPDADPDGLYHRLGRNGAILAPSNFSPLVGELLEKGRDLLDSQAIHQHYRAVGAEIFEDVPLVHLGYQNLVAAFAKSRVKLKGEMALRMAPLFTELEVLH